MSSSFSVRRQSLAREFDVADEHPRDEAWSARRTPATGSAFTLTPVPVEHTFDPTIREEWSALVNNGANPYAQYSSPEWVEHVHATDPHELLPSLALRDEGGTLVGFVPLGNGHYDLMFTVRDRVLWRSRIPAVSILGSLPLVPAEAATLDRLFATISQSAPAARCIYLHSIPTDSFCWSYLQSSEWIREHFYLHLPAGPRPFHMLQVPSTFEQFVARFPRKKRYNLARQVRLLRTHVGGDLRLQRIETAGDVETFAAAVAEVMPRSWQRHGMLPTIPRSAPPRGRLADAGRRGLLRSYVLYGGPTPCALVLGYQCRGVFHYAEIAYDLRFRQFSPGTALLYLMIEDLIEHRPPRLLNFGIGDAAYKREFSDVHTEDASVVLLRKTVANAVRRDCHTGFESLVRSLKRGLAAWTRAKRPA